MAFDPEQLSDNLLDEQLAVATAIADRAAREQVVADSMRVQVTGVPAIERSPEEIRATHLGQSVLLLLQVEDPSRLLTLQELSAATNNDVSYERQAEMLRKISADADPEFDDPLPVEAADVRRAFGAGLEQLSSGGDFDAMLTEEFAKQLAASKRVAVAHAVGVEAVYADDDLYYEALRVASTPQEEASKARVLMDATSTDMVANIAVKMIEAMMPPELRDVIPQEVLDMRMMALRLDPDIQAVVDANATIERELLRQRFLYGFIRTYGYEAISQLSDDDRESLLPQMPLATELAALMPLES